MKWLFVEEKRMFKHEIIYLLSLFWLLAAKNVLFKIISYVIEGFMKGTGYPLPKDPLSIFSLMCCIIDFSVCVYTQTIHTHTNTYIACILWTLWEKAAPIMTLHTPVPLIFTSQEQGWVLFSTTTISLKHLIAFDSFSMAGLYTFYPQFLTQILKWVEWITQLSKKQACHSWFKFY